MDRCETAAEPPIAPAPGHETALRAVFQLAAARPAVEPYDAASKGGRGASPTLPLLPKSGRRRVLAELGHSNFKLGHSHKRQGRPLRAARKSLKSGAMGGIAVPLSIISDSARHLANNLREVRRHVHIRKNYFGGRRISARTTVWNPPWLSIGASSGQPISFDFWISVKRS